MAALNKFNAFVEALAEKKHNLGSDTLKVLLTNTIPVATWAVLTDVVGEVANGGGYTTGGLQAGQVSSAQTNGAYKLVLNDPLFTASTGFGPFKYIVLYNDTAANKDLIGWAEYTGSAITLVASETFLTNFDDVNGAVTIG